MRLGTHFVTGARFPCTCYGYWGYLGAPFANQQILGLQALGLLGLPRGTLCLPDGNHALEHPRLEEG